MQLTDKGLLDRAAWQAAGYQLPAFDRSGAARAAESAPIWIHFGAGNIFRAFMARLHQHLLNIGASHTGILAVEGFDYDIVSRIYQPHDHLSIAVTLHADGSMEKEVIASVTQALTADPANQKDWDQLMQAFAAPSLQMVSFTITEKGYLNTDSTGTLRPDVVQDRQNGPAQPISYMGKIAALLYARFCAGRLPVAMVSMDNCSRNGERLQSALLSFAKAWEENGHVPGAFAEYLRDPTRVGFPCSMIDKITPRPDTAIQRVLEQDGVEDMEPLVTSRSTYIAPYVNAEAPGYLVIEDWFPNQRPPLEKAGVQFTDRNTVDKCEKMKVCTCLNPIHTALAVFGCLLNYRLICDEMHDHDLKKLAYILGFTEGMPAVVHPGVIEPRVFLQEVLEQRLPNPFLADSPQRIATDTSQKLPIRFGETIQTYLQRADLDSTSLVAIPLVLAAWCRMLLAKDDAGVPIALSPDPAHAVLLPRFAAVQLGDAVDVHHLLEPVLKNPAFFGVDLYAAGLGTTVESYFRSMIRSPGAVRETLHSVLNPLPFPPSFSERLQK